MFAARCLWTLTLGEKMVVSRKNNSQKSKEIKTNKKTEKPEKKSAVVSLKSQKSQENKITAFGQAFVNALRDVDKEKLDHDLLSHVMRHHEKMSKNRKKGDVVIEVSNPTEASHGWFGLHTIVDIVADDMVFFIDSVSAYIAEKSYLIEQIFHPRIYQDSKDSYLPKAQAKAKGVKGEMHIFLQLNRRLTDEQMQEIAADLHEIIRDVALATRDWSKIKAKLSEAKNSLSPLKGQDERLFEEYKNFLQYIHDDNFTMLGYREYDVKKSSLVLKPGSALGLCDAERGGDFITPEDAQKFVLNLEARKDFPQVFVTKLLRASDVHRRVPMDAVVVRRFDSKGQLIGELHFYGLFTSVTYSRGISTVPYLWYKVEQIMKQAGFDSGEHSGRALRHILEKYPRDELFQISHEKLFKICMEILRLQERPRIALFMRRDPFARMVTCLIYLPRNRYDTRLRIKFSEILEQEIGTKFIGFQSTVDDSHLVRAIFTLGYTDHTKLDVDIEKIEARLQESGQNWDERLNDTLVERLENEDEAAILTYRYGSAFPVSYQESYLAKQAVHDIDKIEQVIASGQPDVDLYKPHGSGDNRVSLKIYSSETPIALSDILPILENMGLKIEAEYPHEIRPNHTNKTIWIQDFEASINGTIQNGVNKLSIKTVAQNFENCLKGIWNGEIENDSLNKLVLLAGLSPREIVILRTYIRYMRQTKIGFSLPYMEQALTDYPAIAKLLIEYFETLFHPSQLSARIAAAKKKSAQEEIVSKIESELQSVASLDQDKVLRAVLAIMQASLRTNFYQTGEHGHPKSWVSVKLESGRVPALPAPVPYREIFVYSPRVEGIHLRGGKIARGGLRWSDRHEDFRVEVLGLMKAQQVKNSVIVPMGAKGGFVVKNPPKSNDRAAYQAEGVACYQTFIKGLLDVTDNRRGGEIVPPANVVRLDADDPYLVVAADKGTATFSDIANAISLEYGFWLGDAFASGGSAGYDHKKMGITARGAWESVKRHFRELNHNTQTQEFEVIGVGDMAGDVFGNGLIQSSKIRMVGAFNHMHIVCDPNPDAAKTYKERLRLFNAVKGWGEYDQSLLSEGGRIYLRSEKYLKLTPQIQKRFELESDTVSPAELIRAMLGARVDLLFFGGIGTYIKSTRETNADVGDRSNDALRIDAAHVRAKVIGEGANLAMTQNGRIEMAMKGVHLNTDFIDNSAGVDTSDHEVNIKILLSDIMRNPKNKMDLKARNALLAKMTDEVAAHVLQDNYYQTQAISLLERQGADLLPEHAEFMRSLENAGLLNRKVEFLPGDEEIADRLRIHKGLTRPELALLVSYGKLTYTTSLLASNVPDDPQMISWVQNYFPPILREKFGTEIAQHQLRREITAMAISNAVINRLGPTFIRKMSDRTGADIAAITHAYLIVRESFGLPAIWAQIESLDNKVSAQIQINATHKTIKLAERETSWILMRLGRALQRDQDAQIFTKGVQELKSILPKILPDDILSNMRQRLNDWVQSGLPKKLAEDIAIMPLIGSSYDIIQIARDQKIDLSSAAQAYFSLGSLFKLERLRVKAHNIAADHGDVAQAANGLIESLNIVQADLTRKLLADMKGNVKGSDVALSWVDSHCPRARQSLQMIERLENSGSVDFASLVVIDQQLRALC